MSSELLHLLPNCLCLLFVARLPGFFKLRFQSRHLLLELLFVLLHLADIGMNRLLIRAERLAILLKRRPVLLKLLRRSRSRLF